MTQFFRNTRKSSPFIHLFIHYFDDENGIFLKTAIFRIKYGGSLNLEIKKILT